MSDDEATKLYRHFDADGRLLYVGISLDALVRLKQHRKAAWYVAISRVEISSYATREDAHAAERKAIAEEKPTWNSIRYSGKGTKARLRPSLPEELSTRSQKFMFSILEPRTQFMDGWYSESAKALDMLRFWNEQRPDFSHEIYIADRSRWFPISKDRFLASHVEAWKAPTPPAPQA